MYNVIKFYRIQHSHARTVGAASQLWSNARMIVYFKLIKANSSLMTVKCLLMMVKCLLMMVKCSSIIVK